MKLNVYLFEKLAGTLQTTSDKGIIFSYDTNYLTKNNQPLSISLPLRSEYFTQKECLPYFIGLLPEGNIKRRIAQNLHISELSTVKLLEVLGGECAGTVSFYSSERESNSLEKETWALNEENYHPISQSKIFQMMQINEERPLLHIDDNLRLSLPGAQEKIALAFFDNTWHLPNKGAPSTHILKPSKSKTFSTLAINEFICMQLAKQMDLPVPETQLMYINELPIFICERYDRKLNIKKSIIERLHQEDFCQALCIMSDDKYQSDGGPSYTDCLTLIQQKSSSPLIDTSIFLRTILFNYLIGNCDAHAKNFSIITKQDNSYHLSPLYDLVSTSIYSSLTRKMAMKIGNKYDIDMITRRDFNNQAQILDIKPRFWTDEIEKFSETYKKSLQNIYQLVQKNTEKEVYQMIKKGITDRLNKLQDKI